MDRSVTRRAWLRAVAGAPCAFAIAVLHAEDAMQIALYGSIDRDTDSGIRMGVDEANRTAALLGKAIEIGHGSTKAIGLLQASLGPHGRQVPALCLAPAAARAPDACQFYMTASPARRAALLQAWRGTHPDAPADLSIEDWHSSLGKFGASEVNVRFERAYGRPMTSAAWRGWCAVKALAECALRRSDATAMCADLRALRFDAHKGTALFFDPSGQLVHPLYVVAHDVEGGRVLGDIR